MIKGIDISEYQQKVDFEKVKKSGIEFVIIRAGFGKVANQKDKLFESHYLKAKKAGLKVGCYHYTYAKTVQEAEQQRFSLNGLRVKLLNIRFTLTSKMRLYRTLANSYLRILCLLGAERFSQQAIMWGFMQIQTGLQTDLTLNDLKALTNGLHTG